MAPCVCKLSIQDGFTSYYKEAKFDVPCEFKTWKLDKSTAHRTFSGRKMYTRECLADDLAREAAEDYDDVVWEKTVEDDVTTWTKELRMHGTVLVVPRSES